jgi:quinol monooxygenase YgiN
MARSKEEETRMQIHFHEGKLAHTVLWQAKPGAEDAVADILRQLAGLSRQEPGCQAFFIHRVEGDPSQFVLYEIFDDAAAFDAHQQTSHFQSLVIERVLPLLAKRERYRCVPM